MRGSVKKFSFFERKKDEERVEKEGKNTPQFGWFVSFSLVIPCKLLRIVNDKRNAKGSEIGKITSDTLNDIHAEIPD